MSRLFIRQGIWYADIRFNNQKIRKSLGTRNKSTAKKVLREQEFSIIREHLEDKEPPKVLNLSDYELAKRFLAADHIVRKRGTNWSDDTRDWYKGAINRYLREGINQDGNKDTRAITIRAVNSMYAWGYANKLISKKVKLEGGNYTEPRTRVFNHQEINLILNEIRPKHFQSFVSFAYYTGARRGELAALSHSNISESYVVGKSGKRKIKINSQAKAILMNMDEYWSYRPAYISQAFRKNMKRLGIDNARFHDLRRTFGLNLIKQGMSIFKVSKLLGHKSVQTTERHYAPLLPMDVEEFTL